MGAALDRNELISHVAERYGVAPDYPWPRYPGNTVFRHRGNRKWFGILMNVPAERLGLSGDGVFFEACGPPDRGKDGGCGYDDVAL